MFGILVIVLIASAATQYNLVIYVVDARKESIDNMAHRKATRVAVLKAARELISDPKYWIKGKMVSANGKRYCSAGAIVKIDGPAEEEAMMDLAQTLGFKGPTVGNRYGSHRSLIYRFNDKRATTHEDVIEAFDKTIERLEGKNA